MGNLMRPLPLDITLDIKAVYSVLMSLSSKEMIGQSLTGVEITHVFISPIPRFRPCDRRIRPS